MPQAKDLVYQQSTTTGTSDLTLTSQFGKQTFASAFGTGATNTFDYFISSKTANEWEIGVGYIDTTTGVLVRPTTVVSNSSGTTSKISFSAGTKDVTNDIRAANQVRRADSVTSVTANHVVVFDDTTGSSIKSSNVALGTIASQDASSVTLTGGTISTTQLSAETYSTTNNVTAGTNAQGQGALTSDYNVVTTATNNPSGVTLPTATSGRRIIVVNKGANTVNIYPASGASIDALTANAAISLPVNGVMDFNASSTTQWYSSLNNTTTTSALSGTVSVASGGTGLTTLTSGSVLVGAGTSNVSLVAPSTNGNVLTSNGTTWTSAAPAVINGNTLVRSTTTNVTNTTSAPFTGIPSWAKRVTINFWGVSTNGGSNVLVRLGTSAGLFTTGYVSNSITVTSGAASSASSTDGSGFVIRSNSTNDSMWGHMVLTSLDGSGWISSHTINRQANFVTVGGGAINLGTLTQLSVIAGGTTIFDAGLISIIYEG